MRFVFLGISKELKKYISNVVNALTAVCQEEGQMRILRGLPDQRESLIGRAAKQLFVHNIQVNGLKAAVYCHGLSASRYLEYALTLTLLRPVRKPKQSILEIGCGHSILPMFWQRLNVETTILDANRDALKWQIRKSKKMSGFPIRAILADMRCLPFKDESFFGVSCISAIEHVRLDGDIKIAAEIGRILQDSGLAVLSFPLSSQPRSYFKQGWGAEIPTAMQILLRSHLQAILQRLQVDRTSSYFERFFSLEDVHTHVVLPSRSTEQSYYTLRSGCITKLFHQKLIPQGFLTVLEYLIAKSMQVNKQTKDADAIVIKLKKRQGLRSM